MNGVLVPRLPKRGTIGFFFGVLAMVLVLVLMALAGADWTGTPDDQAQWLESVATVAAFVAAIYAARFAWGAYSLETERERRLLVE